MANLSLVGLTTTSPDKVDYEKIQQKDSVTLENLDKLEPGKSVDMIVTHEDGSSDKIKLDHTLNEDHIKWFYAGSALNHVGAEKARVAS